jgi:hypothetical protein
MNDLELIRDLYDDLPDQDATDRDAAVALDALRNHIDPPPPARRRWRGLVRRRTPRVAVALAGVSALVIAGAVLLDGSDSRLAPESAAAYLGQAARSAAQSEEPWRLEPGQYWYVEKKIVNTGAAERCDSPVKKELPRGGYSIRGNCGTITFEDWEAIDDSGRGRLTAPPGPDGQVFRDDHGADPHPQGADRPYLGFREVDIPYRELVEMPGDELAERVRQLAERWANENKDEAPHLTTTDVLFHFARLLTEKALSPDQRAALYRMMAGQPGIRSLGEVTDPEGRPGVAVGRGEPGREMVIIFAPETSKVLAAGTGLAGRTPPGESGQYTVYLKSGIVNSTTETP